MAYAELISQAQNSKTNCTGSDIIGRLWYSMPSNMHEGVKHAKSMQTSYISLQSCSIHLLLRGYLKRGESCHRADQPLFNKKYRFILAITITFQSGQRLYHWWKLKLLTWLILSNTISSIDLVSLGGSSMIMVPNLQARYSISSVINIKFRMWHQLLITPPLMAWRKHSTRQSLSYSKSLFPQISETGMRNLVNVFGPLELRSEPQ